MASQEATEMARLQYVIDREALKAWLSLNRGFLEQVSTRNPGLSFGESPIPRVRAATVEAISAFVPSRYTAYVARVLDPVSVTFCSIPVNHYMCSVICATSQSAEVYTTICAERPQPHDLYRLMTDTNDQITSGVDVSRDLHPTPLRLMRHREDVFRLAERFQWQSKKTDFEIPHSAIIVEDLRKFATASQMTPSRFSKYLVELDAVVEVFMYHNAYTFDVFKAGVLAHRKQHFPQFSWLSSSEAWRNIRETYERRIGPSSVEEALQRRIDNHLSATTSRIIGIIQIGAYLLDEFQYLQSLAEAIRSHLEESEWEIRQKKKEDYQDLDIKVRFAIAYLSFPEPDKLEPINEAYQLVLESVAFFNHTIRHLEILVGSFYQSQNLLHNMSNELSESGFRFLHWENPERMDQSLMAMNRSAVALRASKHAFDLGKQQNDRLLTV